MRLDAMHARRQAMKDTQQAATHSNPNPDPLTSRPHLSLPQDVQVTTGLVRVRAGAGVGSRVRVWVWVWVWVWVRDRVRVRVTTGRPEYQRPRPWHTGDPLLMMH